MTIEALLKDILETNKKIAEHLEPRYAAPNHYERLWCAAKSVVLDGLAYKTDGKDHAPRRAKEMPPITRDQVERCIMRATDSRCDIIPTYALADAVDNIMELINGR